MNSKHDVRTIVSLSLLVGMAVLISAGVAYTVTSLAEDTYTAEAQVVVSAGLGTTTNGDVLTAPRIGQTYAALAMTRPILLQVIARADVPYDPVELARHVRVSADPVSPFIVINATDTIPSRAQQTANALADILIERATVSDAGAAEQPILEIVERAVVPQEPSGPRVLFNTAMAAATALVLGIVIVALFVYLGGERTARQTSDG